MRWLRSGKAAVILALGVLPGHAWAQVEFAACVSGLKARAVAEGIRPETAERALAQVRHLERVVVADRDQPEFVATFASYFARRVTAERVATGRQLFAERAAELERLTAAYGVPGQYIVALWALESNYGRFIGDVPVFDSLATLACDDRRAEYFGGEVVNALRLVERGDAEPAQMIGSWAGAMGQTQFMPTAYLHHAVDGDGDGRIDLWGSTSDALASGMSYLGVLGWRSGLRWGRELKLPEGFDFSLAGLDRGRPLSEWRALGVRDAAGNLLADLEIDAAVLVPSGHAGPAFVVYENFSVLMRWNRSEHFALVVGHLADRIAGGGALGTPPADAAAVTRDQMRRVQEILNAQGYASGTPDGVAGAATRAAVRAYELASGLIADGYVDAELVAALGIE